MKQKRKNRFPAILAAMLLLASVVMIFGGCEAGSAGKYGFERSVFRNPLIKMYDDSRPPRPVAIRSDQTVFDPENVTFDFYYGLREYYPDPDLEKNTVWDLEVYCTNGEDRYVLRTEEIADYSGYAFSRKTTRSLLNTRYVFSFEHSETVRIPKELFSAEKGKLQLVVNANVGDYSLREEEGSFYPDRLGVSIPYEIRNGKIVLQFKKAFSK